MISSRTWHNSACLLALSTAAALLPVAAAAQSTDQAAMEARIQRLEAAVATLTQQLEAERIRMAQPTQVETRVQALETRAAAPAPEGFRVGNTNFRLSGFLKADEIFSEFTDG
ncbi:MAG: hypothetical protein MUF14_01600, partial [Hyphomonadaceae bacterium]|nr:hypothetical protein [Hyphomonadaceae bacterium]